MCVTININVIKKYALGIITVFMFEIVSSLMLAETRMSLFAKNNGLALVVLCDINPGNGCGKQTKLLVIHVTNKPSYW